LSVSLGKRGKEQTILSTRVHKEKEGHNTYTQYFLLIVVYTVLYLRDVINTVSNFACDTIVTFFLLNPDGTVKKITILTALLFFHLLM
jgi:hypothetical protein